jgi:hypothetical protein
MWDQTPELCMMSVKESGRVLQFAREQFTEGCRIDVRQNCMALEYVHDFIVFKNIRGLYI